MSRTLLVANRGEIAVRIMRTARELGLRTVAVYSDADRTAAHVRAADAAVRLGPAPARESYLRADRIVAGAVAAGASVVHPGYGFLAENAGFARAVEAAGLAFAGPTPAQLELFGDKHQTRARAEALGIPVMPGSGLLAGLDDAARSAQEIGFPVLLKATAGGGGIGIQVCGDLSELAGAWAMASRAAGAAFGDSRLYLERVLPAARHVEVQVFGDGAGRVVGMGDRDCTLQRRNQKVVEEAPAPDLPSAVRTRMAQGAVALCSSVAYRGAGTVEYLYSPDSGDLALIEVNARLQVEHTVTEAVLGIDLVDWMLRLALGEPLPDFGSVGDPSGHAVQARIYAEDPGHEHRPSTGLLTAVDFPAGIRVDSGVAAGDLVSGHYDPLLAKLVAHGPDRDAAWTVLAKSLADVRIGGLRSNIPLLIAAAGDQRVLASRHTTGTLDTVAVASTGVEVLRAGTATTVQDWPGRTGLWSVGVPPSGPMDDLSFRLANECVGNRAGAPALECTMDGPRLLFREDAVVCVAGAPSPVLVDGVPVRQWEPLRLSAGSVLDVGATTSGMRVYVAIAGGVEVPACLGSAATFDLGRFGGVGGRSLREGDVLDIGERPTRVPSAVRPAARPAIGREWEIAVVEGPHAAPDFFTEADVRQFYAATWRVHHNASRTGVRLVGPRPEWARPDGGDAGLHPSNIHDTPYSPGAVDYTGDMPVLLGPDGPSLGGFVCPATVVTGNRWKLGQLRPGDAVRFVPVSDSAARVLRRHPQVRAAHSRPEHGDGGVMATAPGDSGRPAVAYRRSGDDNLLVEYGSMSLDLGLRMRVHALASRLAGERVPGLLELTPGIRSLQLHLDPDVLPPRAALDLVRQAEHDLPPADELVVPSRTVRLPLSWDDPVTREAVARYQAGVRADAPWCPWNIEFIRRVNGLDSPDDVRRIVFDAEYLVLGLGDVYLGAPVATPLDPRHRLVTTKYNPARTWTAENSVGIGGAYLCVYGMEGPGGYQLVGRTVQVWNTWRQESPFEPGVPWLLREFDRIQWYPVSAGELLDLRADMAAGRLELDVGAGEFSLARYREFLSDNADDIAAFQARRQGAFDQERAAWERAEELVVHDTAIAENARHLAVPAGTDPVSAPFAGAVCRIEVEPGDRVRSGEPVAVLEAMKTETVVTSPADGTVVAVLVRAGQEVAAGQALLAVSGRG